MLRNQFPPAHALTRWWTSPPCCCCCCCCSAAFLKERLFDQSDAYRVHVCERSGLIAVANLKKQHYSSQIYGSDAHIVQVGGGEALNCGSVAGSGCWYKAGGEENDWHFGTAAYRKGTSRRGPCTAETHVVDLAPIVLISQSAC
jgi:hypothetical protein